MAGLNIKHVIEAVVRPTLDKASEANLRKELNDLFSDTSIDFNGKEFKESLKSIVDAFNSVFTQVGKKQIDLGKMIQMPGKEAWSELGRIAATDFMDGWKSVMQGVSGSSKITVDLGLDEQLKKLKAQRQELVKEYEEVEKQLTHKTKIKSINDFDTVNAKPFKIDDTLLKRAEDLQQELYDLAYQIEDLEEGTAEYISAVLDAREKYNDYARMQKTLQQAKAQDKKFKIPDDTKAFYDLFKGDDREVYEEHGGFIEAFADSNESQQILEAYEKIDDVFEDAQHRLYQIKKEITSLDSQIETLAKSSVDVVKPLKEIEGAYNRIKNKDGTIKSSMRKAISSAINYNPDDEKELSLTQLFKRYNDAGLKGADWEQQYVWLVKFVKEYEDYISKNDISKKEDFGKYTALYEQLKPMAAEAEGMLQNILDMSAKTPLAGEQKKHDVEGAQQEAKADEISAEATRKAAEEAERKAKSDQEAAEAARKAAEEAERERLATEASVKAAQAKTDEVSYAPGSIMDKYANMFGKTSGDDTSATEQVNESLTEQSSILTNIQRLTSYIDEEYLSAGKHLSDFLDDIQRDSTELDTELKEILTTLRLIDENGNLTFDVKRNGEQGGGTTHNGALISDEFVLIERAEYARVKDSKLPTATQDARNQGANVAEVLGYIKSQFADAYFDVQSRAKGQNLFENGVLSPDVVNATEEQLQKLVNAFIVAREHGFDIENGGSNIVYDKEQGFSFYDLEEWDAENKDYWANLSETEKKLRALEDVLSIFSGINRDHTNFDGDANIKGFADKFKQAVGQDAQFAGLDYQGVFDEVFYEEETTSIEQQNEALKENIELKNQANNTSGVGGDAASADLKAAQEKAEQLQSENAVLERDLLSAQYDRDELYEENRLAEERAKSVEEESRAKDITIQDLKEQLAKKGTNFDDKTADGTKVGIDTEALKNVLSSITYNVQIAQKHDAPDNEKASLIDTEALKTALNSITYNAKIVSDDADKSANKIAIDESALESTLNRVFASILNPATEQNDENVQEPWAREDTLSTVKGILDAIQTNTAKIGTVESTQVATVAADNALATESTLTSIKQVLDAINGKIVKGTKASVGGGQKQTETQETTVTVPNGDSKASGSGPTERIKTALTSLLKYKTVLQEANQLSGDLEAGINSLATELGQVADKEALAVWNEHFKQFKNGSSILQTLAKDYRALGEMQAKADNETDPTKLSQYLDNLQILQDRIAVKQVDVNVDDGRFESVYQRAYNITRHQLQQKEELAQATKQERDELTQQANVVSTLKKLYTELGTLQEREGATNDVNLASQYKSEIDEVLAKIQTLRQSLKDITPELEKEFSSRTSDAAQKEANAQYRAMAKADTADEETRRKKILAIEKEIGKLRAEADSATNSGVKGAIEQEVQFREHLIDLQKQGLTLDADMEAYQRRRLALLTKEAKAKERAEKADIKDAFKENERLLDEQIKQSQKDANYKRVQSAERAGQDALWQLGTFNVDSQAIAQNAHVQALYESLNKLHQIQQRIADNGGIITSDDAAELQKATGEVNKHTEAVKQLINSYNMFNETNSVDLKMTLGAGDIKEQLLAAANAAYGAKFQFKSFDETMGTMTGTVKVGTHEFQEVTIGVNQLNQQIRASQGVIKKTEGFWESFGRKLNEIFRYFSASSLIYKAFNELRQGIQYIREIDAALVELRKVTDETEETYDEFLNTAAKTADKLGSTISQVTEATATFAKLGYSMEMSTEMAEAAIVYKNVGDNIASTEDAADSIISTLKGFGLEASESMRIVDRFNEVGNKFAITSQGLGEALRLSASALNEGGNTLDESIGIITAANEVVNDPSSVGTALKTLTLRLRGAKTELEEMGEDVSDMATTTSQLQAKLLALTGGQVDIMLDENTFKSSTQILREMAAAWESMTDIQQASALELMGGKRQANVLSALISNFDTAEAAIEASAKSAGSALRENEVYLDSIQGRIDLFNNSVQTMWKNTLDSDVVKDIVNLGTEIVKIIDKVGLLGTALIAISAYKGFGAVFGTLKESGITIESLTKKLGSYLFGVEAITTSEVKLTQAELQNKLVKQGLTEENAKAIIAATGLGISTDKLSRETLEATLIEKGYSDAQREEILTKIFGTTVTDASTGALLKETVQRKLANSTLVQYAIQMKLATAEEVANMTITQLLALGFHGLAKAVSTATVAILKFLFTNPVGWVTLAIGAIAGGIAIFNHFHKTTEELTEELNELKSKLQDVQSELDSVNSELETTQDRMAELLALPSLSFTEQEELDRLREQNEELERRERLLKAQEEREKKRVAKKAAEVVDSQLAETSYTGEWYDVVGNAILNGLGGAISGFLIGNVPGAIVGAVGGIGTGIGYELLGNQISTEDKLNEEIESYEGLITKRAELEKKLTTASDEGTGLFGWGKSEYDQTKEELEKIEKAIGETESYIDETLGELGKALNGVEYGDGADEALDKYYNALYKWEIEAGTIGAESDGLAHIFSRPEHEAAKEGIDKYVKLLKDGDERAKAEIEKIIANNDVLVADIRAMGLEIKDAVDYFTMDGSGASADIIANYEKGLKALDKFKDDKKINFTNKDGTVEKIGFGNLFDADGEVLSGQIAKVMQGADETTRQEFEKLMQAVKDGKYNIENRLGEIEIDWEAVAKSWNISGGLRVIAEEMEMLSAINIELFPGLEDEIKGIIDSFDELISAVGNTVSAMDALDQARAEEAYSGSVSLETLEKLMQSTDNYADLIEVDETGAIKLATNAQDILVQEKIDTIKKNAELALSSAQMQLAEAKHNQQIYTESSPAQEVLRSALAEVGGAAAFVTSLWNDLTSGNLDGAWERAKSARNNAVTTKKNEYASQAAQAATSVAEAEKAVADAEKMKKIADGLTPENIKSRYDSEEASGGTSNKEDAEKKKAEDGWEKLVNKYENKLALITNERDLIEAEIDRVEAQGGKASADYYKDLIRNQNEEKILLEDNYEKMKLYMDLHKDEVDQDTWTEWNNTLNEMAVGIKECTTNLLEYYDALEELDRHYFDQAIDDISRLGDEIDFVIGLIDDADVAESDGTWTEEGIVQIGMFTQKMEHAAQMTKYYKDELNKVNASWAAYQELLESATDVNKDGIIDAADLSEESLNSLYDTYGYVITSEEEYKETSNELTDSMHDSIDAQNEARDGLIALAEARIDAIKEGIEEEIEAYEDYIDVVKEALDAERDLYDFKKNIGKQTKDIAALERRIASLSGSTNAADVAERRKLEAELLEAKEGLNDTYYDHSRDVQSQALDDEAQSFSDAKEKYMEELDLLLEDTETLIQNMILEGILNADVISQFLTNVETQYGAPLSTELTQPWEDSSEQARIWKENLGVYIGEVSPFVVNLSDEIKNKLGDGTDSAWTNATNTARGYADFLTSTDLNNDFSKTLTGFGAQIQKIIDKWNDVKQAADEAYVAQTRKVTVGGNPNIGDGNSGGDNGSTDTGNSGKSVTNTNVAALQQVLNGAFGASLDIDGKLGPATTAAIKNAQGIVGAKVDGKYGMGTYDKMRKYLEKQAYMYSNSGRPGDGQRYSGYVKMLPVRLAKGTMGLTNDQLAITDESWIGEEITLAAGKNGQLQYLKKGSAVMPADISANLVEWGKLNPDMMKVGGGANINMISNAVNSPEIKIDVENFLKVDRVDKDTLPELEKMMDKKIDNLVRQLNYSIKKFR